MASTSAWSSGLSTSIAAMGLLISTARIERPSLRPTDCHALVQRTHAQHRAEQQCRPDRRQHAPAFLALLLDRAPLLDRGQDAGGAEREQVRAAVAAAAEAEPRPLRLRKTRQQRTAFDDANREIRAFGFCRELGDHRWIEQRMIGGRDQHRETARRDRRSARRSSQRWSPRDARMLIRESSGSTGRRSSGSCVSTMTSDTCGLASSARSGRSTIGSPPTGISALWPSIIERASGSPCGRDPASRSAVQRLTRPARRRSSVRAQPARSPARAARRGRSG